MMNKLTQKVVGGEQIYLYLRNMHESQPENRDRWSWAGQKKKKMATVTNLSIIIVPVIILWQKEIFLRSGACVW